jgi:RsiW-degrading membrane proteinase PrsW (M82 family)
VSPDVLFIAFLGGVVPACIWLCFWLMEDRCEPEPKRYILYSFIAGMAAVLVALPLERAAMHYYSGTSLLMVWAVIEEMLKFAAAYIAALHARVFDEPLDAVIYLVTVALGFAALENTLFILTPLMEGDILRSIITGDLRFMGATLLHTLASATIGIMLAYSFYKPAFLRRLYAAGGVVLAILLHALFNFFILDKGSNATFWIFLSIWFGVIAMLLLVERVKQPTRDYC